MDREAIVRGRRRKQVEEALEEERGRETALFEQLEEVVTEEDGGHVDEQAFARMDPGDVALVRAALPGTTSFDGDDDNADFVAAEEDQAELEREIERLGVEIEASRRRQLAYGRYLEALDLAPARNE